MGIKIENPDRRINQGFKCVCAALAKSMFKIFLSHYSGNFNFIRINISTYKPIIIRSTR